MNNHEFILALIDRLLWPGVFLVAVILLRRALIKLLPLTRRLKFKELEMEFSQSVRQLQADADELFCEQSSGRGGNAFANFANISTNMAIVEAWEELENVAFEAVLQHCGELDSNEETPYRRLQEALRESKLLDEKSVKIFGDLRILRNKVAHAPGFSVSRKDANEYLKVAEYLKQALLEPIAKL